MRVLPLKPNHKRIAAYHESLAEFEKLGVKHESAVRAAFQALLEDCTSLLNRGREDKANRSRRNLTETTADKAASLWRRFSSKIYLANHYNFVIVCLHAAKYPSNLNLNFYAQRSFFPAKCFEPHRFAGDLVC